MLRVLPLGDSSLAIDWILRLSLPAILRSWVGCLKRSCISNVRSLEAMGTSKKNMVGAY
jgi:hypothetical protein